MGNRSDRGRRRSTGSARRTAPLLIAGRVVACAVSGAVLTVCGFSWYTYHQLTTTMNTSDAIRTVQQGAPPHLDKSVNLLLIGLDSRKDQDGNDLPDAFVKNELHAGNSQIGAYETNTLILMHIPADGGKVQAFSIPRDDYVDLVNAPGKHALGKHKIKEAYNLAKYYAEGELVKQGYKGAELEHKGREAGRQATLLTVQSLLNMPIDHFAELNLKGFYDVAKVLQPITVCLKRDVKDPTYARTASNPGGGGGSGFEGHAGENQLDASQALAFVRQRHNLPDGDFDRTHRQQAYIASVTTKLKQEGVFGDLGKMQGLLDAVKQDVVIDSSWNILDFAQQATNLTGGKVEFNTLPKERYDTVPNEGDVNIIDVAKIRRLVRTQIGVDPGAAPAPTAPSDGTDASPTAAPATVDVTGASSTKAADASKDLVSLGYAPGRVSSGSAHSRTTVVYGTGAKAAAAQIADHLNVASATYSSSVAEGHVLVTLGSDYTPPSADTPTATPSDGQSGSPASTAYSGPAVIAGGIPCVE